MLVIASPAALSAALNATTIVSGSAIAAALDDGGALGGALETLQLLAGGAGPIASFLAAAVPYADASNASAYGVALVASAPSLLGALGASPSNASSPGGVLLRAAVAGGTLAPLMRWLAYQVPRLLPSPAVGAVLACDAVALFTTATGSSWNGSACVMSGATNSSSPSVVAALAAVEGAYSPVADAVPRPGRDS